MCSTNCAGLIFLKQIPNIGKVGNSHTQLEQLNFHRPDDELSDASNSGGETTTVGSTHLLRHSTTGEELLYVLIGLSWTHCEHEYDGYYVAIETCKRQVIKLQSRDKNCYCPACCVFGKPLKLRPSLLFYQTVFFNDFVAVWWRDHRMGAESEHIQTDAQTTLHRVSSEESAEVRDTVVPYGMID